MKAVEKDKLSTSIDPSGMLFEALRNKAEEDKFIPKAIEKRIEDIARHVSEADEIPAEFIGSISEPQQVNLMADMIYWETVIEVCERKADEAKRRHKTVMDRCKQVLCDRFELPDDEPIKLDVQNMRVLRGEREAKIEDVKKDVNKLFKLESDELNEIIRKEGGDSFAKDLAVLLVGDDREKTMRLCKELFEASQKDREFLEAVIDNEDVPKPIRYIADFIKRERRIACHQKKIIEWN